MASSLVGPLILLHIQPQDAKTLALEQFWLTALQEEVLLPYGKVVPNRGLESILGSHPCPQEHP